MSDGYDEEIYPDGYDEANNLLSYDEGEFVIDIRWPDAEFEIGIVHEIEEDGLLVHNLREDFFLHVPASQLPYIQGVGDSYYDKIVAAEGCCKKKKGAVDD